MKRKVYVETSIVSYLTARPSGDPVASERQQATRRWCSEYRFEYDVYISELVVMEAGQGDSEASPANWEPTATTNNHRCPGSGGVVSQNGYYAAKGSRRCDSCRHCYTLWSGFCAQLELPAHRKRRGDAPSRGLLSGFGTTVADPLHPTTTGAKLVGMFDDPIVDEIRRLRDEHAARFNYDLKAIVEDLQKSEAARNWPRADLAPQQPQYPASLQVKRVKRIPSGDQ